MGEVCVVRRALIKGGVRPFAVVESDTVVDDPFGLAAFSDFMQIDGLLFQLPSQPFNEDVIQITAPHIH